MGFEPAHIGTIMDFLLAATLPPSSQAKGTKSTSFLTNEVDLVHLVCEYALPTELSMLSTNSFQNYT